MTFARLYTLFVELTAAWALLALLFFTGINLPIALAAIAFYGLHLLNIRSQFRIPGGVWTALTLLALALSLFGWFVLQERFYSVVFAFIYLQLNKLWTYESNRDVLQILGISFFHILASAVSTASPIFAPVFAVYLFMILGALILHTMKVDSELALDPLGTKKNRSSTPKILSSLEEASKPKRFVTDREELLLAAKQRRVSRTYFFTRLVGAKFFILLAGLMIFFIIPRMHGAQVLSNIRGGSSSFLTTGFSDQVNFVGMGEIESDPSIIARAIPETGGRSTELLRLRGTSLDNFNGRQWRKSQRVEGEISNPGFLTRETRLFPDPIFSDESRSYLMRIQIEPNRRNYLFGPDRSVRFFGFPRDMTLRRDLISGSVQFSDYDWRQPLQYYVEVRQPATGFSVHPEGAEAVRSLSQQLVTFGEALLGRASMNQPPPRTENFRYGISREIRELDQDAMREIYMQIPDIPDMEAVRRLAREWTEGIPDRSTIVRTIEQRLSSEYSYSLDVSFSRREDHITHFLTQRKAGHCEYFATAMVLMLRSLDIPARIVNGYATDEWSGTGGGYYLVRQENAHSWVEVWYPHVGWLTYDPSPGVGIGSSQMMSDLYRTLSRWYDSVKFLWYRNIIDYSSLDQHRLWRSIFAGLRNLNPFVGSGDDFSGADSESESISGAILPGLVIIGLIVAGGMLVRKKIKKKKVREVHASKKDQIAAATVAPYRELLETLNKRTPREAGLTPLEYAQRVVLSDQELKDFLPLTETYYSVRFNGATWSPKETERAKALLRRLTN